MLLTTTKESRGRISLALNAFKSHSPLAKTAVSSKTVILLVLIHYQLLVSLLVRACAWSLLYVTQNSVFYLFVHITYRFSYNLAFILYSIYFWRLRMA